MSRSVAQVLGGWGPPLALMALMFAVSAMPEPPPIPGGITDIGAHGIAYALLGALLLRALAMSTWQGVTWGRAAGAWLIATAYGATDEFHQRFVAGRVSDVRDLSADALGALAGILLVLACSIVLSTRRRS